MIELYNEYHELVDSFVNRKCAVPVEMERKVSPLNVRTKPTFVNRLHMGNGDLADAKLKAAFMKVLEEEIRDLAS